MGTFILNKQMAPIFQVDKSKYNVMIRITSPGSEFYPLKDSSMYRDVLELYFYDFNEETQGLTVFNDGHLRSIINFFETHKNSHNMVIHCDKGMSRSAGVAVGWHLFIDDRHSIYKIYHSKTHLPNKLIVNKFLNYFNKPKMAASIKKWEVERFST